MTLTTTEWAILLKPIVAPIFFFVVVAPIAWLLFHLFPSGRLKVFFFRDRTGRQATPWDKRLITYATLLAYVAYFAWIAFLSHPG